MDIVGYYVGPTVDTRLGDGTLLCSPWCYKEWRSDLFDELNEHLSRLAEFGYIPDTGIYERIQDEIARQSMPLFDTEEMDYRPVCEECLARYVASRQPGGSHLLDPPEPLTVTLTSDGVISEGAGAIDHETLRRGWNGEDRYGSVPGAFESYAWPGGYTLTYVVQTDKRYGLSNETFLMCAPCAKEAITTHLGEYRIKGYQTYDEGPPFECDGWCGEMIEASYGDPEICKGCGHHPDEDGCGDAGPALVTPSADTCICASKRDVSDA
jgi:hypothetical protein